MQIFVQNMERHWLLLLVKTWKDLIRRSVEQNQKWKQSLIFQVWFHSNMLCQDLIRRCLTSGQDYERVSIQLNLAHLFLCMYFVEFNLRFLLTNSVCIVN